ncbi:hypothetical protein EYW49_04205 [Siculibacillus lacustris]|uniref:Uncharacterized protein n=1 Tax=Siculibacillus lacustris TaxID=1549641 RepID=A0A4Q9VWY4_9HYPH|nr:hypothetical protein [Siculibacillus lacustris]TBW40394.1 hypothetical protein EYW49_04205 [Siculibacillus lacustris]
MTQAPAPAHKGPAARDPLTAATAGVAWLILVDKPLYPLSVWWWVGDGVLASAATLITAPLWAALAWGAGRAPRLVRIALPLLGLLDTVIATRLFGAAAGTELFLVPCLLLAVLAIPADEPWTSRILVATLFLAFVAGHGRFGPPLQDWSGDAVARLAELNAFAVASLSAYLGLRFAALRGRTIGADEPRA